MLMSGIMMNRLLNLTFLSVALLHGNQALADTVFIEQNGRLIVEVESVPAPSDWHQATEFANYTGSGHLEWTGANNNSVRSAGDGTLTYHFTINTPGNYEFRWRSYIGEGNNGTEHNDSWVRFPTASNVSGELPLNGWTKAFMNTVGDWSWRTVTVDHVGELIRQHFTAGEHTIEISGRSRGHVLDRFALFKYDTVRFHEQTFTNAPQSPNTGDEVVVIDPPQPTPEPTTDLNIDTTTDNTVTQIPTPAPEPMPQFEVSASQHIANECSDGVISLRPVSDIYIDFNKEINNTGDLRLNDSGLATLLQFDLSSVPATVTSALLTFSTGADAGHGSVLLSAGSHSDWNETNAALLPDVSHFIGSFNDNWGQEKRYGLPFDNTLIGTDKATLFMEMAQGSSALSIVPSLGNNEPRLQLTGSGSFCADYDANRSVELAEQETAQNLVVSETEQNVVVPEPEITTRANPEPVTESEGGGSFQLLELLLLTSFLAAIRRRQA